jgi:small-conductance mechanosensitive channel
VSEFHDLLSRSWLGNTLTRWAIALGISVLALVMLLLIRGVIRSRHARFSHTAQRELFELPIQILSRTTTLFLLIISITLGLSTVELPHGAHGFINGAITVAVFFQLGIWGSASVNIWIDRRRRLSMERDRAALTSLVIIGFVGQILVWALTLLLTLDNLGVNITALLAGLGVGGVAVALAVQNVLGDLLASISIALDKPFVVGDSITIDTFSGTVEDIGLKSTRLRATSGEQIVMSNADLLKSRLRNFRSLRERRLEFRIGVAYETSTDLLQQIPPLIRAIIESQAGTRFDRSHLARLTESAMEFETVWFFTSPEYNKYMDTQQAIYLRLHAELQRLDVRFAYPMRRMQIERSRPDKAITR